MHFNKIGYVASKFIQTPAFLRILSLGSFLSAQMRRRRTETKVLSRAWFISGTLELPPEAQAAFPELPTAGVQDRADAWATGFPWCKYSINGRLYMQTYNVDN